MTTITNEQVEVKIAEVRGNIEGLRSYVEKRFNEQTRWTIGLVIAATAIIIALLR